MDSGLFVRGHAPHGSRTKKRAQFLGVFHPQTPGFRAFWGHVSRAPKARGLSENHAAIVRQKIE